MNELVKLSDVSEFVLDGTHGSPRRTETGIPVLSALNVKGGRLSYETNRFTSEEEFKTFDRRIGLTAGDLLLTIVGTIGRAAIVDDVRSAVFQRSVAIIRPKREKIDSRYLFHVTQSASFRNQLDRATNKSAQAGVYLGKLKETSLPLPTLKEQKRIAAILDQSDELSRKRQRAIDRLSQLGQAIFIEMFGEWDRPEANVETVQLGDQIDFLTSGSRGWAEYYSNSGSLFLRIQNVKKDELDLSDVAYVQAPATAEARRTRVQPGDVLLSITADLGRTAVVPEGIGEAYINQHLAIVRAKRFNPRFLSAALSSPSGQRLILKRNREGVKAGLNFDDVRSVLIPDVEEERQRKFCARATAVDGLMNSEITALAEAKRLFASLQHRAFSGEL